MGQSACSPSGNDCCHTIAGQLDNCAGGQLGSAPQTVTLRQSSTLGDEEQDTASFNKSEWIDSISPPAAVVFSRSDCGRTPADAWYYHGQDPLDAPQSSRGRDQMDPHRRDYSRSTGGLSAGPSRMSASTDDAAEGYFMKELAELKTLPNDGYQGARPPHTFSTGAIYHGEWRGNTRHGIGIQTWTDGTYYAGRWDNDAAHGPGRFVHADGDMFIGQWRQNSVIGYGTCVQKQGLSTYRGEWAEDLQHGHGVEQWEGGARFAGQFVWGRKEGQGVYVWPDGSTYTGEWHSNSINGFGHYVGKDGREFRGNWMQAKIHGCGHYEWPDGRSFKGQYMEDQKQGFGEFSWQDNRKFTGFWDSGLQHGHGILYLSTGQIYKEGIWEKGKTPN